MSGSLYFITGPTAVGKTELSLRWAESRENPTEILSCDSLLIYRGMDIGTAKPSPEERQRVAHYGIDLASPDQPFSIVDFVEYARRVVDQVCGRGHDLLVTGGSGFYLKSFFAPVIDPVEVPPPVASSVRALYREQGYAAMVARIRALNPDGLGDLDLRNPRRVMRALERCLASGKQLVELQEEFREQPVPFADIEKKGCLLTRSRESLAERIALRTRRMLEEGLLDEVKALLSVPGFRGNPSASGAIGYRETMALLDAGATDLQSLEAQINFNTRKLVKKQQTWFGRQIPIDQELDLDTLTADEAFSRLFHKP